MFRIIKHGKPPLRLFACLLAAVSVLLSAGCGIIIEIDEESTAAGSSAAPDTTAAAYETVPAETLPEGIKYSDLPDRYDTAKAAVDALSSKDLSDYTVMITVQKGVSDTLFGQETDILYESYSARNALIAEKYGLKFYTNAMSAEDISAAIKASIKAGSDISSYFSDLLLVPALSSGSLAVSGYLLDLRSLPYYTVKTEGSYAAGIYKNKCYFDFSSATEDPLSNYALYFNCSLVGTETSDALYTAAITGNLSFETFLTHAASVKTADGGYTLAVAGGAAGTGLLGELTAIRYGMDFVDETSGSVPTLYSDADGISEAVSKTISSLCSCGLYKPAGTADELDSMTLFVTGGAVFRIGKVTEISESLYREKISWGLLPLPYAEGTSAGVRNIASASRPVLCATANNSRPELTGILLTAFDAASGDWLCDGYIARCTKECLRDNSSYFTLQLILAEKSYCDFSYLYTGSVKELDTASYAAARTCAEAGTPIADTVSPLRESVNKALKSVIK